MVASCRIALFVLGLLGLVSAATAQSPATLPTRIKLQPTAFMTLEPGFTTFDLGTASLAYRGRGGALLTWVVQPQSFKGPPPYLLVEDMNYSRKGASIDEISRQELADIVRSYYETAINLPALNYDPGNWKKARLSNTIMERDRFSFGGDITFAKGTYHVEVLGLYTKYSVLILSQWTDVNNPSNADAAMRTMVDGVEFTPPNGSGAFVMSFVTFLKVLGVVFIVAVAAIQGWVIWRDKQRERESLREYTDPDGL